MILSMLLPTPNDAEGARAGRRIGALQMREPDPYAHVNSRMLSLLTLLSDVPCVEQDEQATTSLQPCANVAVPRMVKLGLIIALDPWTSYLMIRWRSSQACLTIPLVRRKWTTHSSLLQSDYRVLNRKHTPSDPLGRPLMISRRYCGRRKELLDPVKSRLIFLS